MANPRVSSYSCVHVSEIIKQFRTAAKTTKWWIKLTLLALSADIILDYDIFNTHSKTFKESDGAYFFCWTSFARRDDIW